MHGPDPTTWRNIARHDESFNDLLYAKLKATPWWIVSIAFHGLLVLILFQMDMSTGAGQQVAAVETKLEEDLLEPLEQEPPKPDIQEMEPVEETAEEVPIVEEDVPVAEEEVEDEMIFDENIKEIGKSPFDGPSTNRDIGIGGGSGLHGNRISGRRRLAARGGGKEIIRKSDLGLEWLKNHQDPDGYWDCDGFMAQCKLNQCDGAGHAMYDPGVSGLALLAFLGAGETHKHGDYKKTVAKGLRYLKQIQDPEGCFGPRTTNHFTYNHAIAALAMTEAFALTGSPLFKSCAQKGIDFIHKCQNPYLAWRYGVRPQDNDTSVSGWMIMALKSAKAAHLRVDEAAFDGMRSWLEKATEPEYGRVGYTTRGSPPARPQDLIDKYPADKSESLTAVGILSRIFTGEDPRKSEMIQRGTDLCMKALPVWDEQAGAVDMYYWYYGTLALFQVGGKPWERWEAAIEDAILKHQREDGDEKGSWDPVGPWGRDGGRVYSTATMVMCMEVYYRYKQVFGTGGR